MRKDRSPHDQEDGRIVKYPPQEEYETNRRDDDAAERESLFDEKSRSLHSQHPQPRCKVECEGESGHDYGCTARRLGMLREDTGTEIYEYRGNVGGLVRRDDFSTDPGSPVHEMNLSLVEMNVPVGQIGPIGVVWVLGVFEAPGKAGAVIEDVVAEGNVVRLIA